jgi:hypothetical protein
MRHKTREMLVSQRTQLLNALRGHLTEVGVIAPQGLRFARELAELIEACDETIPFEVCEALAQLRNLDEAIARLDRISKMGFDVAIAERETHIEPNGVPDDRRRKLVAGKRDRHPPSYPANRDALPLP